MIRTMKTRFYASKHNLDRLFACNRESANVWNECISLAKTYAMQNNGRWIGKTELQKLIKGKYPLHSQSIQAVAHKYLFSRDGARQAKQKGYINKYPYKTKKYFNTKWANHGFMLHQNGKIELSMGIWERKRQSPIVVYVKDVPKGQVKEIELVYDRGLRLCLSYEDGIVAEPKQVGIRCAIDVGEIHTIATVAENGANLIITGRKIRSIKRLRNKKLAKLQRKMSKCQKGSRQWKRYNHAKQYVLSQSDKQLQDALHKTTKAFVEWACQQQVKQVAIGDVEGVQRGTSRNKKKNAKKKRRRRIHNQKMGQWQFGKLFDYLTYKLKSKGISIEKVNESYTSQQCPCCGKRKKIASRTYVCSCGYTQHRDIHGACGILSKVMYHGEIQRLPVEVEKTKYLRIA
ncbi:putative transposase [Aneurinibacillus soli]|uniref:Putative transposase DNA-binding domain protein n=1 Tax=Aneurinibacillus soli TaxID=1500254 RepID=A0A0U5B534_9BACL|nr:RNA-guided endonuclease TnpB family protein [Aneurinibacillus soli]PYE60666.1 putative transposase [Aneurinibacillus soli]BAU29810.1 putative transposase DNA-binding domain protein [Aneurinibacillus soli]